MNRVNSELPTRVRLQNAALNFFSTKGFDATTVDEIAESIGMKGPIIYKYFSGKEDILTSLHDVTDVDYVKSMGLEEDSLIWIHSGSELKEFTMHQVNYTINNDLVAKFRKMCAINQFRNKKMSQEATKHSYDNINNLFEKIFKDMIKNEALIDLDPRLMALEYTSPITVLIQLCDREPERKEELLEKIEQHIDFFVEMYCKKK